MTLRKRLRRQPLTLACLGVVAIYATIALLATTGLIAKDWSTSWAASHSAPSWESWHQWFGSDLFGRSVLLKLIQGCRVAMIVGFFSSLIGVLIGAVLGAMAGFLGRRVDDAITWLYTTLASVPHILLLMGITYAFGRGVGAMIVALSATSWVSLARVMRAEVLKQRELDYVVAARSVGASRARQLFRHILPNVSRYPFLHFSLQFSAAIKAEVILSFLGLGAQGLPSWGIMIDDSRGDLFRGAWWQFTFATLAIFVIVAALNILGDAFQDEKKKKNR